MAEAFNGIRPTMSYGDFGRCRPRCRSGRRNPKVKQIVLAEVEGRWYVRISWRPTPRPFPSRLLAKALKRPENFVGMHFFNPVHMMPLVEVIRGENQRLAVATTVATPRKWARTRSCQRLPRLPGQPRAVPATSAVSPSWSAPVSDFVRIDKVMENSAGPWARRT